MAKIISESNCVRIDDVLIPKNSVRVIKLANSVRLSFNSGSYQDIKFSDTTIDNVQVSNLSQLFDFFKNNFFAIGNAYDFIDGNG